MSEEIAPYFRNEEAVAIRPARPGDEAAILRLIVELATFERAPDAVQATEASLARTLFGVTPAAEAIIAETGGEIVGLALYFQSYSTWSARPGLYLEDLYVSPPARGSGAGKALLARLAAIAVERDHARVEWAVLDWNEVAIGFYRSLGAVAKDEWTVYRLDGDALARLAQS